MVTRIREEFYTEKVMIPFEHQEFVNEAIPEGESRLSQSGVNGVRENTFRRVFEDGIQVSDTQVKSEVITKPVPEIVMIGSQEVFTSLTIPGKLAYLSAGNAWIIENATANRRCVVSTGDLDGRIFSLSKDGNFLLFTRLSSEPNSINSLWIATVNDNPAKIIDLGAKNIIHYAEFSSDSKMVAYSTGEWLDTTPGWQANNDLYEIKISSSGDIGEPELIKEAGSGGVYGWWGMDLSWSPDQTRFLFSRPDGIGTIDLLDSARKIIFEITPYQTDGDWAWVPGVSWSPEGKSIYTVNHVTPNENKTNGSQQFDLVVIHLNSGTPMTLVQNVGMFAYPIVSPTNKNLALINLDNSEFLDENAFSVAYLQAIYPAASETSDYRLFIVDGDGSNRKSLFPEEDAGGLKPQHIAWSPMALENNDTYAIALIYNGNIWIIETGNGIAHQITGDGLTSRIDWR